MSVVAAFSPSMPDDPNEDVVLMLKVKLGDEQAFEELIARHQARILGTVAKMLGNATDAEDISQQVFVRVWQSASRYQPTAKFTTWLLTITRNLVFNEMRRLRRAKFVPMDVETEDHAPRDIADETNPDAAQAAATADLQVAISRAIATLPEQQRLALILRRYEELSYEEIAAVLKTSVPSVKSLLFRARTMLKDQLHGYL